MYHKVLLMGHLGQDPDIRSLPNGTPVAHFSVACNRTYKGNKKTQWFNVSVFGGQVRVAQDYLRKGDLVFVEGDFNTSRWTDKNGVVHNSMEVRCDTLRLMLRRASGPSTERPRSSVTSPPSSTEGEGGDPMTFPDGFPEDHDEPGF
jgi:single-strand DNA-binding protein